MLQKARELFALRKQTSEKVIPQNVLYSERKEQSSNRDPRTLKLNVNLIFNKGEYKSIPDTPQELAKRRDDLLAVLASPTVDMKRLRELSWKGVETRRDAVWKMLLGVVSNNVAEHGAERLRVRRDYEGLLEHNNVELCPRKNLVGIDLRRTYNEIEWFSEPAVVAVLTRVLCLWDMTGVGGYLQGMSDLAAIMFMVLVGYDEHQQTKLETPKEELALLEAELYFMCSSVFSRFFGYYSIGEKGALERILRDILRIVKTADHCLGQHFEHHSVELVQFAFRWIYVMLSRELPLRLVFRLWDCYFSTEDFNRLHSFVVASLLLRFSLQLLKLHTFGELMKMLQALPTGGWSKKDVEMLAQEATVLMNIFAE